MQPTQTLRTLLVVSGLIASGVGAAILLAPHAFHATHGVELAADPSLLSEVRAPGGALLVLGALMTAGAFARPMTLASTTIAAAVYLSYGASRLLALALDGLPAPGLLAATILELALGTACALTLARSARRARAGRPLACSGS